MRYISLPMKDRGGVPAIGAGEAGRSARSGTVAGRFAIPFSAVSGVARGDTLTTSLALYRIVVGLLLAAWFGLHEVGSLSGTIPADLAARGPYTGGGIAVVALAWLQALPPSVPWMAAACACVFIAAGVMARGIAAGTLLFFTVLVRGRQSANAFEDYVVAFLLLWLVLLPADLALRAGNRSRISQPRASDEPLTTRLFLVNLGLLYLNVGFWRAFWNGFPSSAWLPIALLLVPALQLMPRGSWPRRLSIAVQLATHAWLAWQTGAILVNAMLASTGLPIFGQGGQVVSRDRRGSNPIGFAPAMAACYTAVALVFLVSHPLGLTQPSRASSALIERLGVGVDHLVFGQRPAGTGIHGTNDTR